METHQVRKLADLANQPGREQPAWVAQMAKMRRKTLIVCAPCHRAIHHGKPAANCTSTSLKSRARHGRYLRVACTGGYTGAVVRGQPLTPKLADQTVDIFLAALRAGGLRTRP